MHSTKLPQETHPILIFDGVCNLCEWSVAFIVKRDKSAKFRFVAAQSDLGHKMQNEFGIDAIRDTTMVLLKDGNLYTKSDAAIEIAKDLDGLWKVLRVISVLPRSWRDSAYTYVANNRYRWFGQKQECLLPGDEVRSRFPGL
jgi:predicted DCC family thiol-disulfide oxidoreductase YuxK